LVVADRLDQLDPRGGKVFRVHRVHLARPVGRAGQDPLGQVSSFIRPQRLPSR